MQRSDPPKSPSCPDPQAVELFCTYLRGLEVDPQLNFESFQEQHPEHAVELESLLQQYERVTGILERLTPSASFSARLRAHYGDSVDPGISLNGPGPPADSSSSGPKGASTRTAGLALARLAAQHPSIDRYETKLELARGGMGAIMEVWDKELRRTLAMKVVLGGTPVEGSSQSTEDRIERRLSRFLEEAQITGQLDHPGIVPVHDIGIDDSGRVFFTMQLVDGYDLRKVFEMARLGKDGWSLRRVVSVFVRVCEAMAYAHSKGVVHRDLKPANIMVGAFGEAFVMDWGLAKVLDTSVAPRPERKGRKRRSGSTRIRTHRSESDSDVDDPMRTLDGDVVGTPAYMAPEQARGALGEVGMRSDVYSMGAMLYHLLAGQAPFEPLGEKVPAHTVLEAVRKSPPWPLVRIQPDVDGELAAICQKAMSREIEGRYTGMLELSEDLRAWVEGRGVNAYTTGTLYEFRKWILRNKLLAFSLSVLPLVVIASLTVLSVQQRSNFADLQLEKSKSEDLRAGAELASQEADTSAKEARDSEASMREQKLRADEAANTAREETLRADAEAQTAEFQRDLAALAQRSAELVAYRSLVTAAAYSLQLNDASLASSNLDACPITLRGWEWDHVDLALDFSVGGKLVQENAVTDLAVDASGETLITYGLLINPRIWDVSERRASKREYHHPGFLGLGLGPQNRFEYLRTAISPNAKLFAVSDPATNTFKMFNAVIGEELYAFSGHDEPITSLEFSPDGDLLVCGSEDGKAILLSSATSRVQAILEGHAGPIWDAGFDPSGQVIATCGTDRMLRIWNLKGELLREFGGYHGDKVVALDWSPDGTRIVTGCHDGGLAVWDVQAGSLLSVMNGHRGKVYDVLFSQDGKSVFSASEDSTVRIWNAKNGRPLGVLNGHEKGIRSLVRVGHQGEVASASMDATVRFWNAGWNPGVTHLHTPPEQKFPKVTFGSESRCVLALSVDDHAGRYDVDSARELPGCAAAQAELGAVRGSYSALALCLAGSRYALASSGGKVELFNSRTLKREASLDGFDGHLTRLAISQDGQRLATGSRRGPLYSVDVATDARVEIGLKHYMEALALSPDGAWIATVESDDRIRLIDARTGELLATSGIAHTKLVTELTFSSSGNLLASASRDGTARLWNLPDLAFLGPELQGRGKEQLTSVSICTSNGRVATGSNQGRVQIWSLESHHELYSELVSTEPIEDLEFSPDGKRLVVSSASDGIRVLESDASASRYKAWLAKESTTQGSVGPSETR